MNTRKTNWRFWLSLAIMVLLVPLAVVLFTRLKQSFYLSGLTIIVLTIAAFFLHFESRKPQARELVLLAVLCALAVASRAAFGFVPHFKPMLAIVMLTGIAFGPEAGFLCGAISGFASNFIFGQGPWTPWQMLAFGVAGLVAGLLADARVFPRANLSWPRRIALATVGFVLIVGLVGPILDTSTFFYLSTAPTPELAAVVYLAGLPVNAIHGAATALTLLVVANPLLDQLARVRVKYGLLDRSRPNCP